MSDWAPFIRDVPDFPSPGILFKDITPLLASPEAFQRAIHEMAGPFRQLQPQKVLGIEARGFMFGAGIARELHIGFVPLRKPGKLPRESYRIGYGLEYGKDSLEVHKDACHAGERVLIVDDVLATGGTAEAAGLLADQLGAQVVGMSFFIELASLNGRQRLSGRHVQSILLL